MRIGIRVSGSVETRIVRERNDDSIDRSGDTEDTRSAGARMTMCRVASKKFWGGCGSDKIRLWRQSCRCQELK